MNLTDLTALAGLPGEPFAFAPLGASCVLSHAFVPVLVFRRRPPIAPGLEQGGQPVGFGIDASALFARLFEFGVEIIDCLVALVDQQFQSADEGLLVGQLGVQQRELGPELFAFFGHLVGFAQFPISRVA